MKKFPTATLPVLALRAHWLRRLNGKDHSGLFFQSHRGFRASKRRAREWGATPNAKRADESDNLSLKLGTATRENL